ncbi:MAG: sigma-70 family RNA polymerase sigma factor, partial [Planctomycetota bacterium]
MEFVRTLALALVHDESVADDVAQETLIDALAKPPRLEQGIRAWFSGVVRNKVRMHHRGEGRRRRWEREGAEERERLARNEALAEDALQRAELRQRVVQSVLDLPEPYRLTLILRYLEERTPSEIAEWTGEPLSTVKTRLQRGMDRIRRRFDDEFGDRKKWNGALVLLASPDALRPAAISVGTASAVATPLFACLAAVVFLGSAWWWLDGWAADRGEVGAPSVVAGTPNGTEGDLSVDPAGPSSSIGDTASGSSGSSGAPNATVQVASRSTGLLVEDTDGMPIGGARVSFAGSEEEWTTSEDGWLAVPSGLPKPTHAEVRHAAFLPKTTFLSGDALHRVVLRAGEPLRIRVIDARDGRPIRDATVELCGSDAEHFSSEEVTPEKIEEIQEALRDAGIPIPAIGS